MKEYVVITKAPKMDFRRDYVALPANYGTQQYYQRADIKAIYKTVYDNLDLLNKKNNFVSKLRAYEKVLIKPNLVSVYHNGGMKDADYPESTDPRVFDAVVSYSVGKKQIVCTLGNPCAFYRS